MKNKIFLIIASYVAVMVVLLFFSVMMVENNTLSDFSKEYLNVERKQKSNHIKNYMIHKESVLFAIEKNNSFKEFIKKTNNTKQKKNIQELFSTLISSQKDIFQIRYLDETGDEIIRLDNYEAPEVIEEKNLQNKKTRYYFKDTMKLQKGELYFSNIDLNMEFGVIQKPIIPTLRVATPIFSKEKRKGILIININLSRFLAQFQKSSQYDVNLIYENGDVIVSPIKKYNFTRDFNLFTNIFDLYPFLEKNFLTVKSSDYYTIKLDEYTRESLYVLFVSKDYNKLNSTQRQLEILIYILMFVTLLGLPFGYFVSRYIEKLYNKKISYEKLHTDNQLVNSVINSTEDLIYYKDNEFKYLGCNKAFEKFVGKEAKQIIGKTDFELFNEEDANEFRKCDEMMFLKNDTTINDKYVSFADGSKKYLHIQRTPFVFDSFGSIGVLGLGRDITELQKTKERLKELSYLDELTKVFNRKAYNEKLDEKLDLFNRYKASFCIAIFDIDDFKYINDTYGHDVGDKVLIELSTEVKNCLRKTDSLFRVGGEEFVMLLPKTKIDNGMVAAKKVLEKIESLEIIEDRTITVSMGITQVQEGDDNESIFKRADELLYVSKTTGKNKITSNQEEK